MCWCFCGCWYLTISVTATCIYREDLSRVTASHNRLGLSLDLPRVTASHNRLDLSLSKCIRHEPVAKINGKKRPCACEALGRISVGYSRARRAPAPIASPHHATSRPAWRGERAHVFPHFSYPPHTCTCIESNSPYK
jgi:hypothetical protein